MANYVYECFGKLKIMNFPDYWEDKIRMMLGYIKVKRYVLDPTSNEYNEVARAFCFTMPSNIGEIRRVQNKHLWDRYKTERKNVRRKNRGDTFEKMLWYGH